MNLLRWSTGAFNGGRLARIRTREVILLAIYQGSPLAKTPLFQGEPAAPAPNGVDARRGSSAQRRGRFGLQAGEDSSHYSIALLANIWLKGELSSLSFGVSKLLYSK